MFIFVYGTLKMGGANHPVLKELDARFLFHYKKSFHTLIDIGHGFPYMVETKKMKDFVIGEIYEIGDDRVGILDRFEGVPHMYQRVKDLTHFIVEIKEPNRYKNIWHHSYKSTMDLNNLSHPHKKMNYWKVDDSKVLFNCIVDGRQHTDEAKKIIFHMRFWDSHRAPTNRAYMKLLNARAGAKLDTRSNATFLRDCIIHGFVEEFDAPKLSS